jgi:MutS domain V
MVERLDPVTAYHARLDHWRGQFERAQKSFRTIGNWRLATAVAAAILAWLAFGKDTASGWLLLVPLAIFIALVVVHERVARRQEFSRRAIAYCESRIARAGDQWAGTGHSGGRFEDPAHVYAADLDLFGRGSLFELLSVARTAAGEQVLANWLLAPAVREEALDRQSAVDELRDNIRLREDLALLGEDVRSSVHAEALEKWGAAARVAFATWERILALLLSLAALATFGGFFAHLFSLRPFIAVVILSLAFGARLRKRISIVAEAVETPAQDLRILGLLLERLEREKFQSMRLQALRAKLDIEGRPASKRIQRLERWVEYLDSADHMLVRFIGPVLLWKDQVAMGIEAWRQRTGQYVARWMFAVAELEALSSLAAYAFEHPESRFPELADGGPLFEAEGLRHPLMSERACVPNDVTVGAAPLLLIVSGSNMSGKSTLLRAVGLNAILAWAGAPVAAVRLRVSPLALGASIRVVDSLQDGKSRFYAEITRLRQIVDLTGGPQPVLFLLDELLSGTNSHDRRIGAEAVVRALVGRGAAGLMTTHDLALTEIAPTMNGAAVNVHFEDHLEDGRMMFDFKMRPGVVERSNALELMRAVGLEV